MKKKEAISQSTPEPETYDHSIMRTKLMDALKSKEES